MLEYLAKIRNLIKWSFSWSRINSPSNNSNYGVQNRAWFQRVHQTIYNHGPKATPLNEIQSDIAIKFVYPRSLALVLVNQSDVIAKNIKYHVALWNMDLPDRNDPLPIPVSTFDWIKPNSESGPQNILWYPQTQACFKSGDRLFGTASVIAPESIRGRTYVVYFKVGDNAWYSEIEDDKSGNLYIPVNFSRPSREEYFRTLEAKIPLHSRISVCPLSGFDIG